MILDRRCALERMKDQGIVTKHQVLDHKISAVYKLKTNKASMNFQLVPPDDDRRNLANKVIHTWKDNFIGLMNRTSSVLPDHLWCQAIMNAERQLMLLRRSNVNPKISAYAHV